jgi:uncharacterized integral membrane protein
MALLHRDDRVADRTVDADRTVAGDRATWADTELPADRYAHVAASPDAVEPVVVRKNSFGQTLRTILGTLIVAAIVAFAALNTGHLDVDLGYDTMEMPLSLVIGASALAGLIAGWLFGYRRCTGVHTDRV